MEVNFANRFPVIAAERVTLRQVTNSDGEFIHFMRSDPKVNEFVNRPGTQSVSDAEFFIDQRNQDFFYKKSIYWGIELNTTGVIVGSVTLWKLDLEDGHGELGYDLHPAYQKRGLMSEAVTQVLKFGFEMLQLKEIVAFTSAENLPSQRLLEKFSFQRMKDEEMPEQDLLAGSFGYKVLR